jgi:hypothetical protein
LNSVQNFDVIYDSPTRFGYKVLYKSISTNRHTDTNETFRTERGENNVPGKVSQRGGCLYDVLRRINGSLLGDALGRTEVLETLSSRPASSCRTRFS